MASISSGQSNKSTPGSLTSQVDEKRTEDLNESQLRARAYSTGATRGTNRRQGSLATDGGDSTLNSARDSFESYGTKIEAKQQGQLRQINFSSLKRINLLAHSETKDIGQKDLLCEPTSAITESDTMTSKRNEQRRSIKSSTRQSHNAQKDQLSSLDRVASDSIAAKDEDNGDAGMARHLPRLKADKCGGGAIEEKETKEDPTEEDQDDTEHEETLRLLEKSSFVCMLVGSRQSGKRSIVKCFVKLLNEFKLAAGEYKKEKILTKLMDCAERLHQLNQLEEEQNQELVSAEMRASQPNLHDRVRKRSISQWISSGRVNKLLNLPSVVATKRRVNSMVPPNRPIELDEKAPFERRHTAIGPPRFLIHESSRDNLAQIAQQTDDPAAQSDIQSIKSPLASEQESPRLSIQEPESHRFLTVSMGLANRCVQSDTDINYTDHSNDFLIDRIDSPKPDETRDESQLNDSNLPADKSTQVKQRVSIGGFSEISHRPSCQMLPSGVDESQHRSARSRRESVRLIQAAKSQKNRPFLNLKELNRRRIRIKFNTRRRLNEAYLSDKITQDESRRRHRNTIEISPAGYPDSFMIVYSVNDR